MLEEGIFDIHCHIVPGVDDGAADIEETRKLLEMEYKQGVRNIILTPHFRFQMFETPLEKVQRQFRLAEEAAADISKDLHLYLGCEFHANMEMLPMLREKKVAKINDYYMMTCLVFIAGHCVIDDLSLSLYYNTFWFAGSIVMKNWHAVLRQMKPQKRKRLGRAR